MSRFYSQRLRFWIFIFFILLQIGDGVSTYILAIQTSLGSEVEGNPIAKYVLEWLGVLPGLIVLKGIGILLGLFAYTQILKVERLDLFIKVLIALVLLGYIVVNISNWYGVYYLATVGYY